MRSMRLRDSRASAQFAAEAAYAESIFRNALGDTSESVFALKRALTINPEYAPAMLSLGSIEYQRRRRANGKRLLFALLSFSACAGNGLFVRTRAGEPRVLSRENGGKNGV